MRLILNGKRAGEPAVRDAVLKLREDGRSVEVRVTWEDGDAHRMALEALASGVATIVAGGGDGTVNEVTNALVGTEYASDVVFGVLPLGTANDFAAAAGIPTDDPLAALRIVSEQTPTRIDVGCVNDRHFLNVVSGGYGAEVTTVTNPALKQALGGFAYFLTGLSHVNTIVPRPARITGPGFSWEGSLLAVAVCNGRQAGGGFRVGPRAVLNDGRLDLMILPDLPFSELLHVLHDIRTAEDDTDPQAIVYRQLPEVSIEAPDGLQVNLDGEPIYGTHFDFTVLTSHLRVALPQDSPLVMT